MNESLVASQNTSADRAYARFPRRLRALLADSLIIGAILFVGVQIRDRNRATRNHYRTERVAVEVAPGMPSRKRRVLVIVGYIIVAYLALSVGSSFFFSDACAWYNRCSAAERHCRLPSASYGSL